MVGLLLEEGGRGEAGGFWEGGGLLRGMCLVRGPAAAAKAARMSLRRGSQSASPSVRRVVRRPVSVILWGGNY